MFVKCRYVPLKKMYPWSSWNVQTRSLSSVWIGMKIFTHTHESQYWMVLNFVGEQIFMPICINRDWKISRSVEPCLCKRHSLSCGDHIVFFFNDFRLKISIYSNNNQTVFRKYMSDFNSKCVLMWKSVWLFFICDSFM